jgi:hypothetical protein|tara:strand:+ start:559 stop:1011 length:453 start_codon:yes stop_codon:yes gene_type:complete
MKKTELKKLLKPLIKECIKEVIFEDGVLSGIISEVTKGVSPALPLATTTPPAEAPMVERMRRNAFSAEQGSKIKEHKSKLMAAIGGDTFGGVDLFEGTTPAPSQMPPSQQSTPLAGVAPGDAGVDISDLFGSVGRQWGAHMTELKEGRGE